jgi:hypothetical protein
VNPVDDPHGHRSLACAFAPMKADAGSPLRRRQHRDHPRFGALASSGGGVEPNPPARVLHPERARRARSGENRINR